MKFSRSKKSSSGTSRQWGQTSFRVAELLAEALSAAGVASARERAREIMLLMEGAMVLMLVHGDRSYAQAAARAAKALLPAKRSPRSAI